ncbi:MAG: glycosyltransferase family 2 protein [Gammaproteobacteria bacterium]|nr:glycosyltransferase family 2 protein [Gammaproteobacteria bacterium]
MKMVFWFCLFGACYSYFLYPILLMVLPKRSVKTGTSGDYLPYLSFIITAHNEESRISDKIRNTLALDYPKELLEILIASDASTDNTDNIVKGFAAEGVKLVRAEERKGKEYAQLQAIKAAQGDILVFSDVATQIKEDTLKALVNQFNDKQVGALSSEDRFISEDGAIVGEGAYVKYEMWLRKLESRVNGLVGLSGSFFAARKTICQDWDITVPSDFNTALNCARQGYVAVSDPAVVGYYKDVKHGKGEYGRKFRTIVRGISAVVSKPEVLNPFKFGLFAFQVWSHKIMRWAVPWFLLALFIVSLLLMREGWIYQSIFIAQLVFYGLVLTGALVEKLRDRVFVRIPYYFVEVNIAIAHATIAFIFGKRIVTWTPTKR